MEAHYLGHYYNIMESKNRLKEFQIQKKLGFGSYGVIFKVMRRLDKKIFVLKQIDLRNMKQKMRKNAINQSILLSKLKSPFIVEHLESFIEDNKLNIIMDYCEGGDLCLYLKQQNGRPLKQDKIWQFMLQIVLGLDHIHRKRILHRDIKTLNIFLTKDERIKIGDLGVAKLLNDSVDFAQTMVGTPFYLSPQLCQQKPYNQKSDIWALGCLIYQMCTFRHPFEAANQGSLILKIVRGKYNPISSNYSKEIRDIVDSCLQRDYKRRPTASLLLSRVNCQQKIETLGLKVIMDQFALQQQKKKFTEQLKTNLKQIPNKTQQQTPIKAIDHTPKKSSDLIKKKQEEQRIKKQQQEKKQKQIQRKRRQDEKRIREEAQKRQQLKKIEQRKEQLRKAEEQRKQQELRQYLKMQEIKKEKQQNKKEQLKRQQLRREQIKKQSAYKQQLRKQQLRKDELRKEQLKREQLKKLQIKKQELRKQQLRQEQQRKQQIRKLEQKKQQQLKKKQEIRRQQQQKIIQKIQKTPVQKVKTEKEIQPKVYEKKEVQAKKPSHKIKQSPSKAQVKIFKPTVPIAPIGMNFRQRSDSKKSVGNIFQEKPNERYVNGQQKKGVYSSANLPPRVRKGAPSGRARNAVNPSKNNISKQQEQMVLDLPDNPKQRLIQSISQQQSPKNKQSSQVCVFKLKNVIDNQQVLKRYEQLHEQGILDQQKREQDQNENKQNNYGQQQGPRKEDQEDSLEDKNSSSTQKQAQDNQIQGQDSDGKDSCYNKECKDITKKQEQDQNQNYYDQDIEDYNLKEKNQQLEDVNLWEYDQQPQMPDFEENDTALMQQQSEEQKIQQQNSKIHLQQKLQSNIKREDQLNKLMQLKIDECKKAFRGNYDEVITFFRRKINMQSQYGQQDQKQVDEFLRKKNLINNNKFQNIYKIMHFQMQLQNCRQIIQGLCRKLSVLQK